MSLPESLDPSRSKPWNSWAKAHHSSHWLLNVPLPLSQLVSAVGYTAYNLQIGISPAERLWVWLYKCTAWTDTLINYQRPLHGLTSNWGINFAKVVACTSTQRLAQLLISHGKTTILSPTMFPSGFLQPRFCKIANCIIEHWPETRLSQTTENGELHKSTIVDDATTGSATGSLQRSGKTTLLKSRSSF